MDFGLFIIFRICYCKLFATHHMIYVFECVCIVTDMERGVSGFINITKSTRSKWYLVVTFHIMYSYVVSGTPATHSRSGFPLPDNYTTHWVSKKYRNQFFWLSTKLLSRMNIKYAIKMATCCSIDHSWRNKYTIYTYMYNISEQINDEKKKQAFLSFDGNRRVMRACW